MKIGGIVLVVLGILALVYGGIGYNKQETILNVGGIKATATEHKTFPISPVVGVVAVVAGIAMLVGSKRRG